MSAAIGPNRHLPCIPRGDLPAIKMLDEGSSILTSARALLDGLLLDSTVATDQMWGTYHLISLAEQTIEAAQEKFALEDRL